MRVKATGLALAAGLAGGVWASPASALIVADDAGGFTIGLAGTYPGSPEQAYAAFLDIATWWSDAHTFSGRAGNLSLTAAPGGCWCETLPGGGFVRHMEVIHAAPGRTLVLSGGLGPLQQMGVSATMTVTFQADSDPNFTLLSLTYAVGGNLPAEGRAELANAVDEVLIEQFVRYQAGGAGPVPR